VRWRTAYAIETNGLPDDAATHAEAAIFLDAQLSAGDAWVVTRSAVLCALSAFNASWPEIVQLGSIYTPPELRGQGYTRHAIAAQLRAAEARGARRSVLFTKNPSAVRCYEALGYRRCGDFALLFLS
jgi:predicted GNAT family acetyltransferase